MSNGDRSSVLHDAYLRWWMIRRAALSDGDHRRDHAFPMSRYPGLATITVEEAQFWTALLEGDSR